MAEPDERVEPFYCGTQMADWHGYNCNHCRKRGAYQAPPDRDFKWNCEIQSAVDLAYLTTGDVSAEIGRRMGACDDANWRCGEFEATP